MAADSNKPIKSEVPTCRSDRTSTRLEASLKQGSSDRPVSLAGFPNPEIAELKTNCFVISLPDATERRTHIAEQFNKAGVDFEFFDAVDARSLDIKKTGYETGAVDIDVAEIACFESHRKLWEHCVEFNLDHIAIFEDDILVTADFRNALCNIGKQASDYDVIKLDWVPNKYRLFDVRDIYPGRKVATVFRPLPGAAAYILSKAGARRLLDASRQYRTHLDTFVFSPMWDWSIHQLIKPIAVQVQVMPEYMRHRRPPKLAFGLRDRRSANFETGEQERRNLSSFKLVHEFRKAVFTAMWTWRGIRRRDRVFRGRLPFDFNSLLG